MIIGWIATRLLSAGIGKTMERARSFAVVAVVLVAVLATGVGGCLWLKAHDRAVVRLDDLKEQAAAAERDLRGERAADAAVDVADKTFTAEQAKIKEEQNAAVKNDPEGARRPVGPSSRSYYDGLPK